MSARTIKRTDIYESIFTHAGAPLSFDYFPFWREVLNSPALTTTVPQVNRMQVWKCSRQVGKSVNLGILGMGLCLEHPNINVIITQPTDSQISRFSVQNIKPLETDSIIVERIYKDPKITQSQVKNKSYTTGSRIVLANIYASVLSARGIPGDVTLIDEYQDTDPDHANIIISSLQRSPIRFNIRCGTALEEENHLQVLFDESTGTEWAVKCYACNKYNIDLGYKNIGTLGLMCERCHRPIDPRNGIWVDARPDAEIEGYHLNELCVPRDAPGATEWSMILYQLGNNERTVQNEMLGNSYSDNIHPITRAMVVSMCNPDRVFIRDKKDIPPHIRSGATFAGLDWAMETSERQSVRHLKSYTMLSIGYWNFNKNKMEVVFAKRYYERLYDNPEEVIKDIVYWLTAFNVRVCGMDYGVGHKENQRIASIIGHHRYMEIEYTGNQKDMVTWHKISNKFTAGRSAVFDDTLDAFRNEGFFEFPKYAGETSEFESDLTTMYRFSDPHTRRTRYGKTKPDDFWQNLVYMRLAYLLWSEQLSYGIVE